MTTAQLPRAHYATSQEIAERAENHLIRIEEIDALLNMREDDGVAGGTCDDYVVLGKVRLSLKEIRWIYDNMQEADHRQVKAAALKLVNLVKKDKPFTSYNFDDALLDVARLGLFLAQ